MGFNFRKSIKIGPARVNLSKSGIGYSVGAGGVRYTKSPKRKKKSKGNSLWEFVKGIFCIAALAVIVTLVHDYWQWILATLAVATVAFIAYWIHAQRRVRSIGSAEAEQLESTAPVPDSDTE